MKIFAYSLLLFFVSGIAIPLPIVGKNNRDKIFVGKMCAINFKLFQIYASLVAFFLPLVIMFIMYTLTIRTLQRQARLVSCLLVHGGKNSPPNSGRRLSFRRKNSSHLPSELFHKGARSDPHFQRRESAFSMQDMETDSSRAGLLSFKHRPKRRKNPNDDEKACKSENEGKICSTCKFRGLNTILKTLRRLKLFFCFESMKKTSKEESLVSDFELSRR